MKTWLAFIDLGREACSGSRFVLNMDVNGHHLCSKLRDGKYVEAKVVLEEAKMAWRHNLMNQKLVFSAQLLSDVDQSRWQGHVSGT